MRQRGGLASFWVSVGRRDFGVQVSHFFASAHVAQCRHTVSWTVRLVCLDFRMFPTAGSKSRVSRIYETSCKPQRLHVFWAFANWCSYDKPCLQPGEGTKTQATSSCIISLAVGCAVRKKFHLLWSVNDFSFEARRIRQYCEHQFQSRGPTPVVRRHRIVCFDQPPSLRLPRYDAMLRIMYRMHSVLHTLCVTFFFFTQRICSYLEAI